MPSLPNEYASSGYLSTAYGPFSLGSDPANSNFNVRDLIMPGDVAEQRFERRRTMLETVDEHFRKLEKSDALDAMDTFYQRAYGLISSQKAREAFDLNKEAAKLRDEYGRNAAGQRILLARRLVEAGVRFVSLTYGGWDIHGNIKGGFDERRAELRHRPSPRLITDLEERGMLDSTLVMVSSEFGRTPKINSTAGRDHWPRVFSVALAGGGFKKGIRLRLLRRARRRARRKSGRPRRPGQDHVSPASASTPTSGSWPPATARSTSSTAARCSTKSSPDRKLECADTSALSHGATSHAM